MLLHAIIYDSEVRSPDLKLIQSCLISDNKSQQCYGQKKKNLQKMYISSIPRPQKAVLWMLEMMAASQDDGLR